MSDFEDDFDDDIDLERFEDQQNEALRSDKKRSLYDQAVAELRAGKKESQWMWFIFPQCDGIPEFHGNKPSEMTFWFGVAGLPEAEAYLQHEVLGPRLIECFRICLEGAERDPVAIFGEVDAAQFCASATFFSGVKGADPVFREVIDAFFGGTPCPATKALLG